MPEYATITTSVTGHGSDEAVVVVLQATPVVPNHLLEYAAEPERISVGKVQARAGDDGVIRLRIPLGTDPAAPLWRFEMRLEYGYGKTRSIDLGSFQVAESTTLAALMFPDMGVVESVSAYPGAGLHPGADLYPGVPQAGNAYPSADTYPSANLHSIGA